MLNSLPLGADERCMPFNRAARATIAAIVAVAGTVVAAGCGGSPESRGRAATAEPARVAAPTTVATPKLAPVATTPPERAADASLLESNPIPAASSLQLPPLVNVTVKGVAPRPTAAQIRSALTSPSLALAPKAHRRIRDGEVSGPTLAILLAVSRQGSQLLVHAVGARRVQLQATSLADTRRLITTLRALPASSSITIELHPVRPDFADEAQPRSAARASDVARRVVAAALSQVGVPYSWGGGNANGPTTGTCAGYHGSIRPCPATRTVGFDCSGLTLFAYAQVGITLDHYAAFQWLEGRRIAVAELMPGDLVFFNPKADGPGHMGMYVGNGAFVHAPRTGDVVKVSPLAAYARSYMGAVRPG